MSKPIHLLIVILSLMIFRVHPTQAQSFSEESKDKDSCTIAGMVFQSGIQEVLIELKKNKCFNPETDPDIQRFYSPNRLGNDGKSCAFNESPASVRRMHRTILRKSKKYGLDPRLVYIRMLGEARGNPYAQRGFAPQGCVNPFTISASPNRDFGIFQFLGKGYRQKKSYAEELLEKMQANERKPQGQKMGVREVQVNYYFDQYVSKFAKAAKYTKCKKEFKKFSNIQKLAYLGVGDCREVKRAQNTIFNNKGYVGSGATRLYQSIEDGIPVCEIK